MEIQRQCEGKMAPPTKLPMFSIDLLPKTSTLPLLGTKALMSPYPFFMKSPFQLSFYSLSSKLIPLSCLSRHEIWPWGWEDLYKQTWERKSDHMPLSRRRWRKQESQTVFSVPVHVRNWIKAKKKKKKRYQNITILKKNFFSQKPQTLAIHKSKNDLITMSRELHTNKNIEIWAVFLSEILSAAF